MLTRILLYDYDNIAHLYFSAFVKDKIVIVYIEYERD